MVFVILHRLRKHFFVHLMFGKDVGVKIGQGIAVFIALSCASGISSCNLYTVSFGNADVSENLRHFLRRDGRWRNFVFTSNGCKKKKRKMDYNQSRKGHFSLLYFPALGTSIAANMGKYGRRSLLGMLFSSCRISLLLALKNNCIKMDTGFSLLT